MEYDPVVRSKGPKKHRVTWVNFENKTRKKARNRRSTMHSTTLMNERKQAHKTST